MSASTSSVAANPMGSTPQISPASLPTFSGLLTPTPTSSNSGCRTISGMTSFPTKPVPQTTTLLTIGLSLLQLGALSGQVRPWRPSWLDHPDRVAIEEGHDVFHDLVVEDPVAVPGDVPDVRR